MSGGVPQYKSIMETALTIVIWHINTFPLIDLKTQRDKFDQEVLEFYESKGKLGYWDIMELADMYISACGLFRFAIFDGMTAMFDVREAFDVCDCTALEFSQAVTQKMLVNKTQRKFTKHKDGQYYGKYINNSEKKGKING